MRSWFAIWASVLLLVLSIMRGESRAASVWPTLSAQPAKLRLRVRDGLGRAIAARVRVAPSSWSERVRLRRFHDARWVLDKAGGELSLPAGSYRVFVSRGPEWAIAEFGVQAHAGMHAARNIALEHQISLPGWHGADLHVHTRHSPDAFGKLGVRALDLQAEGVELAAGTDHNQIADLGVGISSVAGAEITTWQPEIGHFNAFPLRRVPRWRHTTPQALFAELMRDPSVFVQINHPRLEEHIAYFALGGFTGEQFVRPGFDLAVQWAAAAVEGRRCGARRDRGSRSRRHGVDRAGVACAELDARGSPRAMGRHRPVLECTGAART